MSCKRIGVVSQPRGILACWQMQRESRVSSQNPLRGAEALGETGIILVQG